MHDHLHVSIHLLWALLPQQPKNNKQSQGISAFEHQLRNADIITAYFEQDLLEAEISHENVP
jgi:hypothetical protein